MVQRFHPCRIAVALVMSFVLLLNVSQLTQAKTSYMEQRPSYPSQDLAKNSVQYYYNTFGPFAEKNLLQQVDSVTYRPMYDTGIFDRFNACVQYRFINNEATDKALREKREIPVQTVRHTFTFQYVPPGEGPLAWIPFKGWQAIRMDENSTC